MYKHVNGEHNKGKSEVLHEWMVDGLNHITFKFHNKAEVAHAFNCTNLKVLLSIDPTSILS